MAQFFQGSAERIKKGCLTVAALLCVVFSSTVAAGTAPSVTPGEAARFKRAQTAMVDGQPQKALKVLKMDLERERPHIFAVTIGGMCLMQMERYKEAVRLFDKGLAKNPDNFTLLNNSAVALMYDGRYRPGAERMLKAAAQKKGKEADKLRVVAAEAFYRAKAYRDTLRVVEPMLKTAPTKRLRRLAGSVYIYQKAWRPAARQFKAIVREDPTDRSAWHTLGVLRQRLGNSQGAAVALQAAQMIPDRRGRRHGANALAGLYMQLDAPVLSLKALDAMPANLRRERMRLRLQMESGRLQDAVATVRSLKGKMPAAAIYRIEGSLLYRAGDRRAAQKAYWAGAQGKGRIAQNNRLMSALVCWELGQRDKAAEQLKAPFTNKRLADEAARALAAMDMLKRLTLEAQLDPQNKAPILLKSS